MASGVIAAGEPGAAGADHHVDTRVGDPCLHRLADRRDVVLTSERAASWWPSATIIAASVSPDLSSAGVSDTVSTAMRTVMKGRVSSIFGMCGGPGWKPQHHLRSPGCRHLSKGAPQPAATLMSPTSISWSSLLDSGMRIGTTGTHSSVRRCISRVTAGSLR